MDKKIQPNAHVTLQCTLTNDAGERLDEGDEPIRYVHGYSTLVPGLEAGLDGLSQGDEKEIVVKAAQGFGERDDELLLEIDRGEFPEQIAAGDEFIAESDDGDEVTMRVVEVRDDAVIVDANHPFAGETLRYQVRVVEVRAASDAEIAEAATAYEAALAEEHVHDASCGHTHETAEKPALISLSKKKQVVLN